MGQERGDRGTQAALNESSWLDVFASLSYHALIIMPDLFAPRAHTCSSGKCESSLKKCSNAEPHNESL